MTTAPGEAVFHTFQIPSPGPDLTYTLSLNSGLWETELISPTDRIFKTAYFEAGTVTVRVVPDRELGIGTSDRFTLTLDPQPSALGLPPLAIAGVTEIGLEPALAVNLLPLGSEPLQNGRVKRQVEVTNLGYFDDQFLIEVDSSGAEWPIRLAETETGRLRSGEAEIIEIEQLVGQGYFDRYSVWVRSVASPTISTTVEIDTQFQISYQVDSNSVLFFNTDRFVTHTIGITNTGQVSDIYRLDLWQGTILDIAPPEVGPLEPGETTEFDVLVWMGQLDRRENELEILSSRNFNLGEYVELRSYATAPFSLYLPWQQKR